MKVHALYVWLQHSKHDQEDIDLETLDLSRFTLDVMKDLRKTQSRTKEYSRKKDEDSYIQVKVFLGQESQWMAFRKQLEAKYSKQDSTNGDLKMSYVIDDVQDDQGVPTSDDGVVLFRGSQYKVNNNEVFQDHKMYTATGAGYEYVRPYERTKDGRQAYHALCAHYQGRQTHNSLADAAMSTLSSTNFDGRKGGLILESYCRKMRKAVNNLNKFGGSEARLGPRVAIKFFLDVISDKDLSTAITVIRNDVTGTTLDDAITSVQA
jgi:hypothetical protein